MSSRSPHVYWVTPISILGAMLAGVALAIGHHCYYASLAGHVAPAGRYSFGSSTLSKQQANIAAGTAFAFLFKSTLTLVVASSYVQLFWHVMITARSDPRLDDVDNAYSLLQNIQSLLSISAWRRRNVVLTPIALIFWLLPLASVFPPSTLSVVSLPAQLRVQMTSVPQFDFTNRRLYVTTRQAWEIDREVDYTGEVYRYEGPSIALRRLVAATAAQGEILPITPPALNVSWTTNFWGPAIQCNNVSSQNRTSILENYEESQRSLHPGQDNLDFLYFSWVTRFWNPRPVAFNNSTGSYQLTSARQAEANQPTVFMAYGSKEDMLGSSFSPGFEALSNFTVVSCQLYNSSYNVRFSYTNGSQTVLVSRANKSTDTPVDHFKYLNLDSADGTWQPDSVGYIYQGEPVDVSIICAGRTCAQRGSYQAIADAFNSLLYGTISYTGEYLTDIGRTILMDTDDTPFRSRELFAFKTEVFDQVYTGRNYSSGHSRGHFLDAIERLFENVTVSLLSEPSLQNVLPAEKDLERYLLTVDQCRPNFSSPFATSPLSEVTSREWHNLYIYDAKLLWAAYSAAFAATVIAVIAGFLAMRANGATYDANFSTVLRTSRIRKATQEDVQEDVTDRDSDDCSRPLPKSLARATVVICAGRRRRDRIDDTEEIEMTMLQQGNRQEAVSSDSRRPSSSEIATASDAIEASL